MIRINSANAGDINAMFEVDLRAYDYPLGYSELKTLLACRECFTVIASDSRNTIIGYAVFKLDRSAGNMEIVRLGVTPKYRGQGAGSKLLDAGNDHGVTSKMYEMFILVPEILCNPGDPDDVSRWLGFKDFRAVVPTVPAAFYMYGQTVTGIKFVRPIHVA